jgi:hypothetical protein
MLITLSIEHYTVQGTRKRDKRGAVSGKLSGIAHEQ